MTINRIQQLFLILVILKEYQTLEWQQIHSIDSNLKSFEISDVSSTKDLEIFMGKQHWFYFYQEEGSRNYQYNSNVKKIVIGQNSMMNSFPTIIFKLCPELESFSAVRVSLEEIKSDDFESTGNLRYLNLASNGIKRLSNMVFMLCKNLIEVDLSSNEIDSIHDNAFEGMSGSVRKIDLSYNKIKVLKEDSLILLLENIDSGEGAISLSFKNNEIEEVLPSNKTNVKNLPVVHLDLSNNNLKAFECTTLKYTFLNLKNNEIKLLSPKTYFFGLDVSNNMLRELFIKNITTSVRAAKNQLTKFAAEAVFQLDTLILSENMLGNDILLSLQKQKLLRNLELSNAGLTTLSVDTFADLESLEILRLDQNKILTIGYGVFAHQTKLKSLNISYNALNSIDLHVLSSLSSLQHIDISGNNISSIEGYASCRQFFPKLSTIGLEKNFWSCSYFAKIKNSFANQNITLLLPQHPVKNKTNFAGIECYESSDSIAPVQSNNDNELAVKINSLIGKVNAMDLKIDKTLETLKNDFLELKSKSLSSQTSNATSINEVRSLVEQMNNVTLEKQKLAYDQLVHKINEQNVEISKLRIDTERLFMAEKEKLFKSAPISAPAALNSASNNSFTRLEIFLITLFLITILLFSLHQYKKHVNSKLDKIAKQRVSRRNSFSTVVTYDNSSIA